MQCTVCKKTLPVSEFRTYKAKSGNFIHRHACRGCERKKGRERYQRKKRQLSIEREDMFRFTDNYRKMKGTNRKYERS